MTAPITIPRSIKEMAAAVARLDREAMSAAQARLDTLTKPTGSLARLDRLAVQLAGISGELLPSAHPGTVVLMAADHGVTAEGVSAYPAEVTVQMVGNFLSGGAAICVLSHQAGLRVRIVDMGISRPVEHPDLDVRAARRCTDNMATGPAMARAEAEESIRAGIAVAGQEVERGTRCILLGEMGIGNTTASSAILAALSGLPVPECVGGGTGVDPSGWQRKVDVVSRALATNRPTPHDPIDLLAKVGGLEIAGLVGVILGAAARRIPVVLDGFITGAAALVAAAIEPRVTAYCIAAHQSAEPGHAHVLRRLGLEPLLTLDLRLGEGSGAALAYPLLKSACALLREMATFASAGVSDRNGRPASTSPQPIAAIPESSPRPAPCDFSATERQAVYKAIQRRRDIRRFLPDPLPDDLLNRLLAAAHMAPSVGHMQPWDFIIIRAAETKQALYDLVERERQVQALYFGGDQARLFPKLKVEGIREAPVTFCVTCDPTRGGPHVLGRHTIPEADVHSVACAIQNMWLAARAEGVGMGWVTFFRKEDMRRALHIPPHIDPVGLISLGYTPEFPDRPILEIAGWREQEPLDRLLHWERW